MSEKLGPITFGKTEEMLFLGREMTAEKNYSEEVAAKIDGEVDNFLKSALKTAQKIIKTRKKALDAIANTLIEKEVLEQEDFNKVLEPFKLKLLGV